MAGLVRKRNTFWNWKYAVMLFLIPIGFYLASLKEEISFLQHAAFIAIIIWLAVIGVFGVTNRFERLKVYGYLYLSSSLVFAYLGLVLIW
ncbi:hypothetical protein SAMN05192559_109109 [Halobacillus karajensis]|uniref:Uncharacterized protein n=1 Tax=Halobacillus karajensis TaxID=195088 RepID=A0A024P6Q9_9BACI|nr:hypothetical protein [Halobacillus karajensis]CDQ18355.1 hypothetical protein BN982_00616 [Halobacillus karajensis]CDQ24709.1 hypothetical protein BN983_03004 [Halobacillus karajensis]CDQ29045.1 hypothetical protein BN981_03405 [Halobacillus karajensis]SEI06774.1 hypothetical protein SAMN05192559_109109 [Halobacillus karajensis]